MQRVSSKSVGSHCQASQSILGSGANALVDQPSFLDHPNMASLASFHRLLCYDLKSQKGRRESPFSTFDKNYLLM
jgi:hypothetical protein